LSGWLKDKGAEPPSCHLCLEATGPYSESVAMALVDTGWRVSVINPARVKGFAQSELACNKTDRADAALLARFCAVMRPALWQPPSLELRQPRALVDRLHALKDMRQQELNRVEAASAMDQQAVLPMMQEHITWLDEQIARVERDIGNHMDRHPDLKRDADLLKSIPGLGETTIAKMLHYLGDVRRFSSAKALAAYIGVTPRQRQSGTVAGRTPLSRAGHANARKALYMPGLVALRYNSACCGPMISDTLMGRTPHDEEREQMTQSRARLLKIVLQRQLADLGMQRLQIDCRLGLGVTTECVAI